MEHNVKRNIIRAIEIILVFGVALLVLLYALGYYDFTFIDREAIFGKDTAFVPQGDSSAESSSESGNETEPVENSTPPEKVTVYASGTALVFDASTLSSEPASALGLPEGYSIADPVFVFEPLSSKLVKLDMSADLPTTYSVHYRISRTPSTVYPEDDSEKYVIYTNIMKSVPSVELYMGYIMLTYGDGYTYIFDSDGDPLCKIPTGKYTPAYTRDSDGRALFVRVDESGANVYFHITEDGANFHISDYDDNRDGRGLYFDYPVNYGVQNEDEYAYTRSYDENSGTFNYKNKWGGNLTTYNFTSAYAFTGGLAAVTTRDNRGGLFFISTHGYRPFVTWQAFLNEHGRYVFENYLPPLTDGIESIGFYYFDEGLTRVRHQIIDYWNWDSNGLVRVVSDKDILIRPDGSRYDMPAGYTLEGYSNGVLMLQKDGRYGFMHARGEWIAQPIYKSASAFTLGIGILETDDGRFGAIDTDGNIVLPFAYSHISQVSDGVIAAYREADGVGVWELYRIASRDVESDGGLIETIE